MDASNLTDRQRAVFERVRREFVESGRAVGDSLMLEEGISKRDRAAIAEACAPGAGRGYLDA